MWDSKTTGAFSVVRGLPIGSVALMGGNQPSRKAQHRAADMTIRPEDPKFEHPFCPDCTMMLDNDVAIGAGREIRYRVRECGGHTVFFSVQLTAVINGKREVISRIDTDHGAVHQHKMQRNDVEETVHFDTISVDGDPEFLDNAHVSAYLVLLRDADLLIQRW